MARYSNLAYEMYLLKQHYNFIKCKIDINNVLLCVFEFKSKSFKNEYEIKIEYDGDKPPLAFIKQPVIQPSSTIHMYNNKSLCLYYPPDHRLRRDVISKYIVPWIYEWIYNYEIYLITGVWEAAEAPHDI